MPKLEDGSRVGRWRLEVATRRFNWSDAMFEQRGKPLTHQPTYDDYFTDYQLEDRAPLRGNFEAAIARGTPFSCEVRTVDANGRVRVLLLGANVEYAADGSVCAVYGESVERGQIRADGFGQVAAIRTSLALQTAQIGVWQWDAASNNLEWDATMFKVFGRSVPAEQLTGKFFLDSVHPEDRDRILLEFSTTTQGEINQEFRIVRDDGQIRHMHGKARVEPDLAGRVAGLVGAAWDVTELQTLNSALVEEKQRLSATIAALRLSQSRLVEQDRLMLMTEQLSQVGHWRYDCRNKKVFWSDEIYRTFGISMSDGAAVDAALAQYHPEDREAVTAAFELSVQTGAPYSHQSRVIRSDGSVRYVHASGQAERDEKDRVVALIGVFQDVTDAKERERERDRLLERVTVAVQAGNIGIWEWDIMSGTIVWDAYMRELYEVAPGEEETFDHWLRALHPDDRDHAIAVTQAAAAGTERLANEFRIVRSTGDVHHIRTMGKTFCDEAGVPIRIIGTNWDISEVRRAEAALQISDERFRQIEEHTLVGLVVLGIDGELQRVNAALCQFVGYEANELLGNSRKMLAHPDEIERDRGLMADLIAGAIDSFQIEKRYLHKAGHTVWGLVSASIVRDKDALPLFVIGQILDITARKAADQELEFAQKAALAATEAKARFIATMSHEIRTPMNGVIGMTELLALTELNLEQKEFLHVIRDSGRSLLRIIDDILDYSKIESGKLGIDLIDFSLEAQLASVMALFIVQFEEKGVALSTQVRAGVPPYLKGDPGRVRQILINLLGNALKFTPAGGNVQLSVEAALVDASGKIPLTFTVADSGIGISEPARERLFLPFSQVDSSTSRKYGGTGLGLSICKQLVELMGGKLSVVSAPDAGSAFSFCIGFEMGIDQSRSIQTHTRATGDRRRTPRKRPERLLLAEDNAINALVATRQFSHYGFVITVVPNGLEALKAVQNEHYDLVFMDCHMPEMDGFEATKAIRALHATDQRTTPIIAMTANVQEEDRDRCFAVGMNDYVAKPISLGSLKTLLERWLPEAAQNAEPR